MRIYERIKDRRKQLGLTADDVAEALGVSRATVYRYESAYIEKLPVTILGPLAKVLRCAPEYLLGLDDEQDNNAPSVPAVPVLSPAEQDLLDAYRAATPEAQMAAMLTLKANRKEQP